MSKKKKKKKNKFKSNILQTIENSSNNEKTKSVIEEKTDEKTELKTDNIEKNIQKDTITINQDDKKNYQADFKKFILSICVVGVLFGIVVILNSSTNIISSLSDKLVDFLHIQS